METIGRITNRHGHRVTITETPEGFNVWNHEWAVGMNASALETAWELADTDPEILCQD